jgi:hypothetical protein
LDEWANKWNKQFSKEEVKTAYKHMKKFSACLVTKDENQNNCEISLHSCQNDYHQ